MPSTTPSLSTQRPSIRLLSICTLCALLAAVLLSFYLSNKENSSTKALRPEGGVPETITALESFECRAQKYTTQIISLDPLLIYIDGFLRGEEADLFVELGSPDLDPSEIYLNAQKFSSSTRTSRSAGLSPSSSLVSCILARALAFLGPSLPQSSPPNTSQPLNLHINPNPSSNPLSLFGTPQIVQYGPGEHFGTHHDWYDTPQILRDASLNTGQGQGKWLFNRWASFFVYLDEGAEGGETWFPYINIPDSQPELVTPSDGKGGIKWRKHQAEAGSGGELTGRGTDFLPKKGNALFWINLHANGTGDGRTVHAGLRVKEGIKTAMNIWPRVFYRDEKGGQ